MKFTFFLGHVVIIALHPLMLMQFSLNDYIKFYINDNVQVYRFFTVVLFLLLLFFPGGLELFTELLQCFPNNIHILLEIAKVSYTMHIPFFSLDQKYMLLISSSMPALHVKPNRYMAVSTVKFDVLLI